MFRVSGKLFDVDRFLQLVRLKPSMVWRLEETPYKGRPIESSGFSLVASGAAFDDVWQQIDDVIAFLKHHETDLALINTFPGVEEYLFDFGIEDRDVSHQADYFPAELLRLAGNLNISLVISRYPRTPDDAEIGEG